MKERFSDRLGYRSPEAPITVRDDAPQALRQALTMIGKQLNLSPSQQREIVCRLLLKQPDRYNWSEFPNIWDEVNDLVASCAWWKVYDIAETFYDELSGPTWGAFAGSNDERNSPHIHFVNKLNEVLQEHGIGWKMTDQGVIEVRSDAFCSHAVDHAQNALAARNMPNSMRELQMALEALSRRPDPDVTGVVQHSTAALESLVREVTGSPKTLGQASKELEQLAVHPALREAINRLFGYASDYAGGGRHGSEALRVHRPEAELLFHVCAALITYLSERAVSDSSMER